MKITELIKFKFIEDIAYYDGPLLSLGITENNEHVLQVWCDENREEKYNIYAYIFMRNEDVTPFINALRSYYDVITNSHNIVLWKYNGNAYDFEDTALEYFLPNYGPKQDSDLINELIDFRTKYYEFKNEEGNI